MTAVPLGVARNRAALIATVVIMGATAGVDAQQLGRRKTAPPSAEAKVARIITRADLQSNKSDGGGSLKADQLTVTKNCGNVQIGGTEASVDQPRPKSLVGNNSLRNENVTVVRGGTVNICR